MYKTHRTEGSVVPVAVRHVSPNVVAARAPPGAPTLASHGPNVRCKKTYRATQRTNRMTPAPGFGKA